MSKSPTFKTSRQSARKSTAALSAGVLAATTLIATAGSAGAAITSGGEGDAQARPGFFRDSPGIALQLCTAAEPMCEPADPVDPLHGGYFAADATAGVFTAIYGIETAAGEDDAGNPTAEAIVANVARFRADGLRAGAVYTIRDPWGVVRVTADDTGRVDQVIESGGETGTVQAGHVKTFLRRVGAPAGFLGNHDLPGRVTGSPTGFNRVTVTGPGVNASTDSFTVSGQMRDDTAMSSVVTKALSMGNRNNVAPVVRNIRYSSFGTAAATATVAKSGANPRAFAVANNCGAVAPGSACNITVTYTPRANRSASAILTIDDNGLAAARRVKLSGTGPDTIAPKIVAQSPARGATGVARNQNVKVKFTEAVRGAKSSLSLVNANGHKVRARVTRVRQTNRYVLNPRRALASGARYTVRVNGGTSALRDTVNNPARDTAWRFRTR